MTQTVSFRWSKTGGRVATAVGGAALFVSLFLIWSQPDESRFLVLFGAVDRLKANAWQVYSVADAFWPRSLRCLWPSRSPQGVGRGSLR